MLQRLSKAFSHLNAPAGAAPEFTIHLWDSASGSTAGPPTPGSGGEQAPGAFFYYSDGRLRIGYQLGTSGDARVLAAYPHEPTPALSVLDTQTNEAWYWVSDAVRIPYWEQATPMVYLFDWWLRDRGCHLLHAGAVGTEAGGALLVGKSGSGKSTSSLSALDSELAFAGDDYVAVALEPGPYVHGLYASGKLMPDHVHRLPFLLPALANADRLSDEKAVVYVEEQWPGKMTAGFPLSAILVARIDAAREATTIEPVSPAMGLAALAPSTVFQMHTRGQDSLIRMRRLAERVPSFVLRAGADMSTTPRAISELARATGRPTVNAESPARHARSCPCTTARRSSTQRSTVCSRRIYAPFEIVVCNDGSTDRTAEILAGYPAVRVVEQENRGRAAACNTAIAASRGRVPHVVRRRRPLAPQPSHAAGGYLEEHPEVECVLGRQEWMNPPPWLGRDPVYGDLDGLPLGSAMFRRHVFDDIGGFDPTFRHSEDMDFLDPRARAGTRDRRSSRTIVLYRRFHGSQMTAAPPSTPPILRSLREKLERERRERGRRRLTAARSA